MQKLRKTIPCKFCPEQIVPMGAKGFENRDGTRHKCKALQKSYSIQSNVPRESLVPIYEDKIARLEIRKLQKEIFEIKDELNRVLALYDSDYRTADQYF